jgi:hypothetical protein
MERWKARARRWEYRAAQRRLERRRKTAESTPGQSITTRFRLKEAMNRGPRTQTTTRKLPRRLSPIAAAESRCDKTTSNADNGQRETGGPPSTWR